MLLDEQLLYVKLAIEQKIRTLKSYGNLSSDNYLKLHNQEELKMTEFNDKVERQRLLLAAEEMRDNVTNIHCHRLDSMWYETEKTKPQTQDGVMDITYMDGRIERTLNDGSKVLLVEGKTGDDLIQEVSRQIADSGKKL